MRIKVGVNNKAAAAEWVMGLHQTRPSFVLGTLLAGDRWLCVTDVVTAEVKSQIVGIATIARQGEEMSGQPTMVAVYVVHEYRRQGVGQVLFNAAVDFMIAEGLTPIRVDALNSKIFKMVNHLPPEKKLLVRAVDQSLGGLVDQMMEM